MATPQSTVVPAPVETVGGFKMKTCRYCGKLYKLGRGLLYCSTRCVAASSKSPLANYGAPQKVLKACPVCSRKFLAGSISHRFCGKKCAGFSRRVDKPCSACNKPFTARSNRKLCRRPECEAAIRESKRLAQRLHGFADAGYPNLTSASAGAAVELLVSGLLMLQGWSVFRSLSPACYCDLVAVKDKVTRHLEVRTGWRDANGGLSYRKTARDGASEFAVYIVIDHSLHFFPVVSDAAT